MGIEKSEISQALSVVPDRTARALQKLRTLFGEELPAATEDLAARRTTIESLAGQKKVNSATLGGLLRKAGYPPIKQGRQPGDERYVVGKLLNVFGENHLEVLADRLGKGEKIQDLASEVGISRRALGPFLKRHAITKKKPEASKQSSIAVVSGPSDAELQRLYLSGLPSAEIAIQTGLGESAVDYRLERAGTQRRNRGTPVKTEEQKRAFAKRQLEATFGESLAAVTGSLMAGEVTIKALAAERGIKSSTLATQLRRVGVEVPKKGGKYKLGLAAADPPSDLARERITIFNLVDIKDNSPTADSIIERFARLSLDPDRVAAANDQVLKEVLEFTDAEITYMREQLRKRETGS